MQRLGHDSAPRLPLRTSRAAAEGPLDNWSARAGIDGRRDDEARNLEIRRTLNFGRDAAKSLAALMRRDELGHVCILIDQFEELFEFARRYGPEEARLLAELLGGLFEQRPPGLYVILTMRSFLGVRRFKGSPRR